MNGCARPTTRWFHGGELAIQTRSGLETEAARLEGMLSPAEGISPGMRALLAQRRFAVLTGQDANGRLWCSPLTATTGFLEAVGTWLEIGAMPDASDPLHGIEAGQAVGLLSLDFATRRRIRLNGKLVARNDVGMLIDVAQAYGNCPAYIHQRALDFDASVARQGRGSDPRSGGDAPRSVLDEQDRATIMGADTLFVGSRHPGAGADTSHKGGEPGFVRVDGNELWWPDYAGNNMFNTLGNIEANPEVALLFLDFARRQIVEISGSGQVEWVPRGSAGDDGETGRRVRVRAEQISRRAVSRMISVDGEPAKDNPSLSRGSGSPRSGWT